MSHDDMHVIMYKILSYLYGCMKKGDEPDPERIDNLKLGINLSYWTAIMVQLIERGYVKGYMVKNADNETSVVPVRPTVTMDGVEFLMENSLMAKARRFVMDARGFIPMP